MWLSPCQNGIVVVACLRKGSTLADWLLLFVGAAVTGAALAYVMVVPRRWLPLPGLLVPGGVAVALRSLGTVLRTPGPTGAVGMAVLLCGVGLSAGYWLASASLPLYARHDTDPHKPPERAAAGRDVTVVVLSFAAPKRYRVGRTASHVRRLLDSGALGMPTSALPFVFLAERSRYRAIGDYLPARASTYAIADQMETLLSESEFGRVVIAWSDGSPSLLGSIVASTATGAGDVAVVTLGADGSFLSRDAILDLESASETDSTRIRAVFAPSIWHSEGLACRLVTRILETTLGASPEEVGVVLVGEGQPAAWESFDQGWRERENYFNQRVRLLLTEHGIQEQHVRTAWLEWQTPDVTEAVRHLAALGCVRIVIAPSTIACVTLSTALDLEHMVASARVAENVRTVTLPPWGDDPALATAAADAVRRAIVHE